jgi:hypothetical protein
VSKSLDTEIRTVRRMIALYCRDRHNKKELCGSCRELADYAEERIRKCPYGDRKPACSHCTIHCYKPQMRARIQEVMRVAGPMMVWHHPVLAVRHLIRLKGNFAR